MACACGNSTCRQERKVLRCEHGSYSMYVNHSCRCEKCRKANADVGKKRYEKFRQPKVEACGCGNPNCERRTRRTVVHGLSAYFAHKCRCPVCTKGMREYQRQRRLKAKAIQEQSTSA